MLPQLALQGGTPAWTPRFHPGALAVNVAIIVICKSGCRIERIRDCRHLFSGGSKDAISIRVRKYG